MKATQYLVHALEREGVEVVFGYPGGAIMPLYDALLDAKFKHILVRHEQGAALAADGYARATGKVGVCLATSGPGATNLITGLANAYLDSVPVVAITGQVPTFFLGTDAFQEVDVLGMTMPIVKHSFLPRSGAELADVLPQAFAIARSGRPGPVIVDMPKDVSLSEVPPVALDPGPEQLAFSLDESAVQAARDLLANSRRPVLYAGGGIGIAAAVPAFRRFAETCGIPTATTLKGLGALPTKHPLFLGMLGMHGLRAANLAIQECDLLVVIGARFDDRATGKLAEFAPNAKVIHLDIDPAEVGKLRAPEVALVGPLEPHLEVLTRPLDIGEWREHCAAQVRKHQWNYEPPVEGIYAPRLLRRLSEVAGPETVIACDVGQHQMWVAQHCHVHHPSRHLTSGGLGTMGFGLPAAIGAQLGCPDALVIAVSGDGSIMMNIQELATLARYGIPVKILLLDNHCLGLVRQWQELFFGKRFSSVQLDDNPDFVAVAEAFGIPAMAFREQAEEPQIIEALTQTKGPLLAHVLINPEANVWPLVPPGKSNSHMMEEVQA